MSRILFWITKDTTGRILLVRIEACALMRYLRLDSDMFDNVDEDSCENWIIAGGGVYEMFIIFNPDV